MTSAECQISVPKGRYLVFTLPLFQMPMMKMQDLNTKIITKKPKKVRNCESWANVGYFRFPCLPPHFSTPFQSDQIVQTARPAPVFAAKHWWTLTQAESGHVAPACTNYVPDELLVSGNRYLIPVHSA
jgi:hypothetical protein